jgi:hypothetical protein
MLDEILAKHRKTSRKSLSGNTVGKVPVDLGFQW